MVGQKKRKSDCWLNYKENFSSLIAADGNNERLSCKKAKVHMFPKYRKYEENDIHSSPVARRELSPDLKLKSTPSDKRIQTWTAKKRKHSEILIPLSPITPGTTVGDQTICNRSLFSLHAQNSRNDCSSLDHTPLAVALEETNSGSDSNMSYSSQDTNDIDATSDQNENQFHYPLSDNEEIESNSSHSDVEESWKKDFKKCPRLDITSSMWLKKVREKLDEDWNQKLQDQRNRSVDKHEESYYDSGKKQKYARGSFAEHLVQLKKKNKQLHSMSKNTVLELKVISDVKEGILHVLECKRINIQESKDDTKMELQNSNLFTIILSHDNVTEHELQLGTTFTLSPPWYAMKLANYHSVVLLNVQKIEAGNDMDADASEICAMHCTPLDSIDNPCESLLKAVENQAHGKTGISIVATVQRIFCETSFLDDTGLVKLWSLLCQDAYGTFFVVDIGNLDSDDAWLSVLVSGEGQRVFSKNLFINRRTTRFQQPALFTVIDSIWCDSGQGLLQVDHSQDFQVSPNILSQSSSLQLMPPNYCYFLTADKTTTVCLPHTNHEVCSREDCKMNFKQSNLNRTNDCGMEKYDILYKPSFIMTPDGMEKEQPLRISLLGMCNKADRVDCASVPPFNCGTHGNEYKLTVSAHKMFTITVKHTCTTPSKLIQDLIGKRIIFKDISCQNGDLTADSYSRICFMECDCKVRMLLCNTSYNLNLPL